MTLFSLHSFSHFLSSFLTHFVSSCVNSTPTVSPDAPRARITEALTLCFSILPNTGAFLATAVPLWPQPEVTHSRRTPGAFGIFALCEIKVESRSRALHSNTSPAYRLFLKAYNCTWHFLSPAFPAATRFAFSKSRQSSQRYTVPRQINNRCSNVFFDSYLIFSIMCHFLRLEQCYSVFGV